MNRTFDVVVVGAGIFGASTAYHLRKAGASVLLIEKGATPACGTTGASAAIVRQHYSNKVLSQLTGETIAILKLLAPQSTDRPLFHQVGWYFFVPEDQIEAACDNIEMQKSAGVMTSLIPMMEVAERLPWLNPDGVGLVVFEPNSGYADPVRCTEAFINEFRRMGGSVLFNTKCLRLIRSNKVIKGVVTGKGEYEAAFTVNACGPWARILAASAQIDVPIAVYREQESVWQCRHAKQMTTSSISNAVDAIYVRPMGEGRYTVGRGFPKKYTEVDPNHYDTNADDEFVNDVLDRLQLRFLPFADAQLLHGFASLYDVTPDWYPFVGPRHDVGGYADACGGSGHGFKLAPALGAHLSEWISTGTVDTDVQRLSYDRVPANRTFSQKYGGNRG